MCRCGNCKFLGLRFNGFNTKCNLPYSVSFLKSRINADCDYYPKNNKQEVNQTFHDLPSVLFAKLDHLSKRRFYMISFPVQRKNLWNCSKICANLGKKPIALIVGAIAYIPNSFRPSTKDSVFSFGLNQSRNAVLLRKTHETLLDNFVMNLLGEIYFDFDDTTMAILTRFVEFNHSEIRCSVQRDLSTKYFPYLFTPNVTLTAFRHHDWIIDSVWNLLSNINRLEIKEPGLLKIMTSENCDLSPSLSTIIVCSVTRPNYSLMAQFLKKQKSMLHIILSPRFFRENDPNFNSDELHQNFVQAKEILMHRKGIRFVRNSMWIFFALCDDVQNVSIFSNESAILSKIKQINYWNDEFVEDKLITPRMDYSKSNEVKKRKSMADRIKISKKQRNKKK